MSWASPGSTVGLLDVVHWTGRVSALLFAAALALPAVLPRAARWTADLFLLFVVAHTVHFAFVASYALAVPGAGVFPGSRDLAAGGGWPAVFGRFAIFYLPALLGLAARRTRPAALPWLKNVDRASTLFIAFMFLATYVPLFGRSIAYALPAATVLAGTLLYALKAWGVPSLGRGDPRT